MSSPEEPSERSRIGDYGLVGRTSDGVELFSLDFPMLETADVDGASALVFVVPAEPGLEALFSRGIPDATAWRR